MVGAGVLGLPFAMRYLLWPAGSVLMIFSWVTTIYTLWQMCAMHEVAGRRFNRYHELGQFAFGKRLGLWLVLPCQLIVMIGLDIVYCVTAGTALRYIWRHTCGEPGCRPFGLSAWISVFGVMQIFLAQIPNFHSLSAISLLAAMMSITYSTIAIAASAHNHDPNAEYNLDGSTTADGVFGVMNALGTIAFAYGGHNVVLEIQSTMPSDGGASGNPNPTLKPMMLGVYVAYTIVFYCYIGVGFTGYYAFGNQTGSQIIYSIGHPIWLTIFASVCIIIHVCGSFQVYAMPVFDMIEYLAAKCGVSAWLNERKVPIWIPRLVYRSLYCVLVTFIAILLPFFGDLLGFIGALGFGPTTFTYPPIMWLIVKKPKVTHWQWWACWICAIYGIIVTIAGAIGGLRGIIVDASSYKVFQ
ncbi:hypothetical protein WJX73_007377 [Symbiochloris irregularis]|uniref:Amino acid transporter transmembrane domain-containing protein n=1 Tax=Symbiochloris irregularis TaxID=706552 RepID=A0AAW1PNT6_9CHLO